MAALSQVTVVVITTVITNLFCCSAHGILILGDQLGIFGLFMLVEFDGTVGFGKRELELVNASSCRRLVSPCWGLFRIYGIRRSRTLILGVLFSPILGAIGALLAQRQLPRFFLIKLATHRNFLRSPRNNIDLLAIALQNPTQLLNLVVEVI